MSKLIEKGYGFIKKVIENANIIMGITGAGKTTTVNGIVGKKLVIKKINKKNVVELAEGIEGAKIGHTISETSVPECI